MELECRIVTWYQTVERSHWGRLNRSVVMTPTERYVSVLIARLSDFDMLRGMSGILKSGYHLYPRQIAMGPDWNLTVIVDLP